MFIFLAPTHLDMCAKPISEFGAPIGQILSPPDRKFMRKMVCPEGPQNFMWALNHGERGAGLHISEVLSPHRLNL
jgi:hypothetical protein